MFASILAVFFLGETWTIQNFMGTCLVITGLVIISRSQTEERGWRKIDLIYPILAALCFAVSSNLRRFGLLVVNIPLMAVAANAASALLFAALVLRVQGGLKVVELSRRSFCWFLAAGLASTAGMFVLSVILTAVFLRDLETVTTRIIAGAAFTGLGSILIVTL
jgi:uncharacterized membrane protein